MRKASCVPELCRIEMRVMKNRRLIIIACGTALLIAAAVVVALRERWQPVPPLDVPVSPCPAEVRVKAVEQSRRSCRDRRACRAAGVFDIIPSMRNRPSHRPGCLGQAVCHSRCRFLP